MSKRSHDPIAKLRIRFALDYVTYALEHVSAAGDRVGRDAMRGLARAERALRLAAASRGAA